MSNTIKIRRGSGVPTASDFDSYELAYDYTGNDLYVKVGSNMVKVNSEGSGTVTNVVAGNGLSGGGTVTATLDLDFSQLTDMTSDISGTTEFILQNGTTESRKAASEIKLTAFDATGFTIAGTVDTSGSPSTNEYARFTDNNTIEGRSYAAVRNDLGLNINSDVQAYDTLLQDIADLSTSNPSQDGYVLAYNDNSGLELVAQSGGGNSTATSSFLTGDSLVSYDGYIMTRGIVNENETGSSPAAIVFGNGATYGNDNLSLITAGATALFINSSGNVAIGGTTANRDLQVNGTGIIRLKDADGDPGLDFGDAEMQLRYRTASDKLQVYSYGTTSNVLTIQKSNGNVGIGTESPSQKLEVAGAIKATGTGGFTIGNVAGLDRIQNSSNSFSFLTDGDGYANMTFGTVTAGTWQGTAINATYIGSLPASKITSGTFADARIASSSEWNEAYTWGDHSTAGYLTASSTQSKYLRSDANDTATGTMDFTGRVNIGNSLTRPDALDSDGDAHVRIGGSDVYLYVASLGASGGYDVAVQAARASDFASFDLNLQANGGNLQRAGNKVWDAGNDGSGSGLDADLLDGNHASAFLTSVPNHSGDLITSGTVAAARIANLDASKITSGTIPSARLDSDTAHLSGTQTFTGAKTFSNGINVGGLANGGISGSNYNITGVNAISFNDPGAGEGLNFSNFAIYESPDNLSNAAGNIQFVSGSTRRATIDTSGNLYVQNNITLGGTVDGRDVASDGSKLDGIASGATANAGTVTSVATGTGLTGGTITGSGTISLTSHSGDLITSGTVAAARIANLAASKITSGTFADARIPNLAASKITSGTFDIARIPTTAIRSNFRLSTDASNDANSASTSGIYRIDSGYSNLPSMNYGTLVTFNNLSDTGFQIAADYHAGGGSLQWRAGNSSTFSGAGSNTNWFKIWNEDNDGSGSGLDADLLDGVQASSFLRSDATDTATGALTLSTQEWNGHITWNGGKNIYVGGESSFDVSGSGIWQVWDSGTGAPFIMCDVGQRTEIGSAGNRGLLVHGELESSSLDCNGDANIDGNVTLAAGHYFTTHNESQPGKYRMYGGSSLYAIGMVSGIGYGGLSDWAMTFQFNNEADRGFVFKDDQHSTGQGAMAITTEGKVTIAHSLRIGYGESDTTTPGGTNTLEVAGSVDLRSDDVDAARFLHLPRSGGITFYGDASQHHGIFSRNDSNSNNQDDILITSYGAVYIDLDSNNNNTSLANFEIGKHNAANDPIFMVNGENDRVAIGHGDPDALLHINPGNALCNIKLERQGVVAWRFGIGTSNADLRFDAGDDALGGPEVLFTTSGAGHFDNDVVAFSSSTGSDKRLKKNIKPIPYGLKEVLQMNPVEYDWKEKRDQSHDIGVIAQEIEEIIPEVVKEHEDLKTQKEFKTVDYGKMVAVLIKAVQEQQEQINELKEKLNG